MKSQTTLLLMIIVLVAQQEAVVLAVVLLSNSDDHIRLGIFFLILLILIIWEFIAPERVLRFPKKIRWPINFTLTFLNGFIVSLIPFTLIMVAIYAEQNSVGLFWQLKLPQILVILLSLISLDLIIYWQHRFFHRIDFLWKLHFLHHTDGDIDVSSALRFHLFEIVLSIVIKATSIVVLGVPVVAVIIFEILLNGMAMFNHANIHIPKMIEMPLRKLLVTPDMHRIHHSQVSAELNSNYGSTLSIWDKLFKTYTDSAKADNFELGLKNFDFGQQKNFFYLLVLPFISEKKTGENKE